MLPRLPCLDGRLEQALRAIAVVVVIAFLSVLSSAAFGANPAEELAKSGSTGGIDPKGNSWVSIQQSVEQFGHPEFILRLFLSLSLAVGCAYAIAWHPRRPSLADPLADLEERKALILLGVVGAVQSLLVSHKCRLQSSALYEDKGQMVFLLYIPSGVDPMQLEAEVRSSLKKHNVSKINVDVV